MKVLITGMGGSGKTTTITKLSELTNGVAIDLDTTGLCFWINKSTGKRGEYSKNSGQEWLRDHSWRLDVSGLQKLIDPYPFTKYIFVGGKIAKSQIGEVSNLFDKVFLLDPSNSVLRSRLRNRTNKANRFAKSEDEQEQIVSGRNIFENACLKTGAIRIDADRSIEDVAKKILDIL